MMISVVVPTWNEEHWLPRLLSVLQDNEHIAEIIVADNDSADRTVHVAQQFNCMVVRGGRPSCGRNSGAAISRGDILLFLDADTLLTREHISRLNSYFTDPDTACVHFSLSPICPSLRMKLVYTTANFFLLILSKLGIPRGIGSCIAIRKHTFITIGGFDETLKVGEDLDMIRRAGQHGRVIMDTRCPVMVSTRRFKTERFGTYVLKCAAWGMLRSFGSTHDFCEYNWTRNSENLAHAENEFLYDIGLLPRTHDHATAHMAEALSTGHTSGEPVSSWRGQAGK